MGIVDRQIKSAPNSVELQRAEYEKKMKKI